jgi:hypothetical protein
MVQSKEVKERGDAKMNKGGGKEAFIEVEIK